MPVSIHNENIQTALYDKEKGLLNSQKYVLLKIFDSEGYGLTEKQALTLIDFTTCMNPEFCESELEHILSTVINTFFYI